MQIFWIQKKNIDDFFFSNLWKKSDDLVWWELNVLVTHVARVAVSTKSDFQTSNMAAAVITVTAGKFSIWINLLELHFQNFQDTLRHRKSTSLMDRTTGYHSWALYLTEQCDSLKMCTRLLIIVFITIIIVNVNIDLHAKPSWLILITEMPHDSDIIQHMKSFHHNRCNFLTLQKHIGTFIDFCFV